MPPLYSFSIAFVNRFHVAWQVLNLTTIIGCNTTHQLSFLDREIYLSCHVKQIGVSHNLCIATSHTHGRYPLVTAGNHSMSLTGSESAIRGRATRTHRSTARWASVHGDRGHCCTNLRHTLPGLQGLQQPTPR